MITEKKTYNTGPYVELVGLSADVENLSKDVANGSTFVEIDTGKEYMFDGAGNAWRPVSRGGGGGGGGTPWIRDIDFALLAADSLYDVFTDGGTFNGYKAYFQQVYDLDTDKGEALTYVFFICALAAYSYGFVQSDLGAIHNNIRVTGEKTGMVTVIDEGSNDNFATMNTYKAYFY